MVESYNAKLPDRFSNWRELAAYCHSLYIMEHPQGRASDIPRDFLFIMKEMVSDQVILVERFSWEHVCYMAMTEVMDIMPTPKQVTDMKATLASMHSTCYFDDRVEAYETFNTILLLSSSLAAKVID